MTIKNLNFIVYFVKDERRTFKLDNKIHISFTLNEPNIQRCLGTCF